MKCILAIVVFFSILFNACTPVRTNYFGTRTRTLTKQIAEKEKKQKKQVDYEKRENDEKIKSRNKSVMDTTFVYLDKDVTRSENPSGDLEVKFRKAITEFDSEIYESACETFKSLGRSVKEENPMFSEVKFMICECLVIQDRFSDAEILLNELLANRNLQEDVKQKVMISLGQVYCRQSKTKLAEEMFEQVKIKFPDSKYLPLANCESAKKN